MRFILLLSLLFATLLHADEEEKQVKVFPSGSHYEGNYFAFGQTVEISGSILGDVYVFGGQVFVDGSIEGDLLVVGGSVDVSGNILGNVRMMGGQLLISGDVQKSVTALAGNVLLMPSATLGGSFVGAAGTIDLGADVGTEVTVIASHVRVSSTIQDSMQAYVGSLRLTSKAEIGGNLIYRSQALAIMEEGAHVKGEISYSPSLVQGWIEGTWIQKVLVGSKVLASLMNFIYSFVVGLILLKIFPGNLESALRHLNHHPWKALSFGGVLLIALPLVSLVLLMTILGVPFALTLIAANIIGFYTAKIYTIYWASHFLARKWGLHARRLLVLTTGLVVYFLLTAIPVFGTILAFTAMLFGMGAGVLSQSNYKVKA